jgi:hypothetical protein
VVPFIRFSAFLVFIFVELLRISFHATKKPSSAGALEGGDLKLTGFC